MKRYAFDFNRFTVGHLAALSKDAPDGIGYWAINDLTVGGVYHLPLSELDNVLEQFLVAYEAFAKTIRAKRAQTEPSDDADLRDMLDGIEGLG